MKTLLLILLSFKLSADIPLDKFVHTLGCYSAGATTNIVLKGKVSDKALFNYTFFVPMTIGVGKECLDRLRGGQFSFGDIKADFIGAISAAVICRIIENFKSKKKGEWFFGITDKEKLERNKEKINWSDL